MKVKYSGDQAKKYTDFAENEFSWVNFEKPLLIKVLDKDENKNKTVLDIGCGSGRSINLLKEAGFEEKNISGVDVSSELLTQARLRFPNVHFINSDMTQTSFPKNTFDLVISIMAFHYLNPKEFQDLMLKVTSWLKPSGRLVFIALHPARYAKEEIDSYFVENPRVNKTPWKTEIEYHHKTLTSYLGTILKSGLSLSAFDEPHPTEDSKKTDPENWEKYSKPTRIYVVADKV